MLLHDVIRTYIKYKERIHMYIGLISQYVNVEKIQITLNADCGLRKRWGTLGIKFLDSSL